MLVLLFSKNLYFLIIINQIRRKLNIDSGLLFIKNPILLDKDRWLDKEKLRKCIGYRPKEGIPTMENGYPQEIKFYPREIGIHPRNEPPNPRKNELYPRRRKLKSYVVPDLAKNFILKSSVGDVNSPLMEALLYCPDSSLIVTTFIQSLKCF